MTVYSKNLRFRLSSADKGATADLDMTDDHGLEMGDVVIDGTPITRPSQGDLVQHIAAAQKSVSIPFSCESDAKSQASDPAAKVDAIMVPGYDLAYEIAEVDGTGLPMYSGRGIISAVTESYPNDDVIRWSTTLMVNSRVAGTIA